VVLERSTILRENVELVFGISEPYHRRTDRYLGTLFPIAHPYPMTVAL
jgi:hypothetical protein